MLFFLPLCYFHSTFSADRPSKGSEGRKRMTSQPHLDLSRRERQIIDILYANGRATAAEVQALLPDPPSYSAVRAMLRILEDKGHVRHLQDGPRYLYVPTLASDNAKRSAMRHMLQTFFDGSAEQAISALLDDSSARLSGRRARSSCPPDRSGSPERSITMSLSSLLRQRRASAGHSLAAGGRRRREGVDPARSGRHGFARAPPRIRVGPAPGLDARARRLARRAGSFDGAAPLERSGRHDPGGSRRRARRIRDAAARLTPRAARAPALPSLNRPLRRRPAQRRADRLDGCSTACDGRSLRSGSGSPAS